MILMIAEFGASLVLLDFHLDKERIISELCVERDMIPEMQTCKGQCHLSKKLREVTSGPDRPADFEVFEYAANIEETENPIAIEPLPVYSGFVRPTERSGYTHTAEPVPWFS
jgi:hypothetical protein